MKQWIILALLLVFPGMLQGQSIELISLPEAAWPAASEQRPDVFDPPAVVVALSGYHGAVPLAWKPVASDTLSGYDIYRSTSASGPFNKVANSIKNCYYRDQGVSPGILYHYKIKSIYQNSESSFSGSSSGKAQDNGYVIHSSFSSTSPTIDGIIDAAEWASARVIDVLFPGLTGVVRLYVKNDQNRLYLAVDDQKNNILENWDSIGMFFDRDMDREWSSDAKAEGLIQVYWEDGSAKNRFMSDHGNWPDKLTSEDAVVLSGISQGISATSGHVQTEIAIDLNIPPFNYLPFSAMGFLLYVFDGGNGQFSGAWPQETVATLPTLVSGYLWAYGPFSYGDLILAQSEPSNFWADVDRDHDVDIMDIQLVASRWGTDQYSANYLALYDVNSDGYIDIFDIQLVASWWNKPLPSLQMAKAFANVPVSARLQVIQVTPEKYELWVDNAVDLAAFQLAFTANGAGLWKMELGDFLGKTGNTVIALPPSPDTGQGTITFGAFSYGVHAGASGAGKLAAFFFEKSTTIEVTDIRCADKNGQELAVELADICSVTKLPESVLLPNYPNPFNPITTISFILEENTPVHLGILNVTGREVAVLASGIRTTGRHRVTFSAADLPSGVYFYKLQTNKETVTRKMLLMK